MGTLVECIWKTSAATLAVWGVTPLLRSRPAALRHALWVGCLAGFMFIPALVPLARWTPPVKLRAYVPGRALDPSPALAVTVTAGKHARRMPIDAMAFYAWLGGFLVMAIRRCHGALRMKGIAGRARTRQTEGARISDEIRAPLTWGLIDPEILLPACALEWSAVRMAIVLEHEREHIRRRDPRWHWLGELVCTVWWFHPLAWLARSRAAHERECACDDAVLLSGVRASDYAAELVTLAANFPHKGAPLMALSAITNFERRIKRLLVTDIDHRRLTSRAQLAVTLAALAALAPISLVRAQTGGTADLAGTVTDPSGARVVNVVVIASGSGNREITRSNAVGEWSFAGLPAGSYTVEVRAPGFAVKTSGITLAAGEKGNLPQMLELGQVQETINVTGTGQARAATVQTESQPQRIKVGGNVQATNLIRQIRPTYPASALAQGIEGTVLMRAVIGKDGNLLSLSVMNKLVDPDLAAAALAAVQQWQYRPTLLNGEPVEVMTTITVNFKLQM